MECVGVRLIRLSLTHHSHLQNLRPFSKPRRILICADNRADMDTDKAMCWRAYNVTCLDAAAITAVSLANTPNADVVMCTFGKAELVTILTKFHSRKHGVIHLKKFLSEVSSHYVALEEKGAVPWTRDIWFGNSSTKTVDPTSTEGRKEKRRLHMFCIF